MQCGLRGRATGRGCSVYLRPNQFGSSASLLSDVVDPDSFAGDPDTVLVDHVDLDPGPGPALDIEYVMNPNLYHHWKRKRVLKNDMHCTYIGMVTQNTLRRRKGGKKYLTKIFRI